MDSSRDIDPSREIEIARVDRVERKQSATDKTLDRIAKSIRDSRREYKDPVPITWGGYPKDETVQAYFTGIVYLKGHKHDLTSSTRKAWVRAKKNENSVVYADGPPPDPFPADEAWREVSGHNGNMYID